ncbi:MAG: acetylglutamate kinase, partial [Elusimicrobiota bacterium]
MKVGGSALCRKDLLEGLAVDLACLHHLGIKVVLVHGGGPQASDLSKRLGLEPRLVAGRRVTDEKVLDVGKMAFGLLNTDLTA